MASSPYSLLIAEKRWADRGLYEVAGRHFGGLGEEERTILLRIFDHIHTVDRIFQHHLQGVAHDFPAPRSETLPTLDALAEGSRRAGDWYAGHVEALSAADMDEVLEFRFTSGKPARMTRGEIILHVCLHGAYHRGNAGAVLQLKGIAPGRDAITDYLEETP